MSRRTHHLDDAHHESLAGDLVYLDSALDRYSAGTDLETILRDLYARIVGFDSVRFGWLSANATLALLQLRALLADAYITTGPTFEFDLDAVINTHFLKDSKASAVTITDPASGAHYVATGDLTTFTIDATDPDEFMDWTYGGTRGRYSSWLKVSVTSLSYFSVDVSGSAGPNTFVVLVYEGAQPTTSSVSLDASLGRLNQGEPIVWPAGTYWIALFPTDDANLTAPDYEKGARLDIIGSDHGVTHSIFFAAARIAARGFKADAVLSKTKSGSFTSNATLRKGQTGTLSADAWIGGATYESTFAADAVLFGTATGALLADAVLLREMVGTLTADAAISILQTGSFEADAAISVLQLGSLTSDAITLRTIDASLTADAAIATTATGSFDADAWIIAAVVEGSFLADAISLITRAFSWVKDAVLQKTQTLPSQGVSGTTTLRPTSDAAKANVTNYSSGTTGWNLVDETSLDTSDWYDLKTAGAYLIHGFTSTLPAEAQIVSVQVRAYVTNQAVAQIAALQMRNPDTGTRYDVGTIAQNPSNPINGTVRTTRPWDSQPWTIADIANLQAGARTHASSSPNLRVQQLWVEIIWTAPLTADAVVKRNQTGSVTADAIARVPRSGSFTADAVTFRTMTGSLTADAVIQRLDQLGTFTADAETSQGTRVTGDFTADALLFFGGTGSITADADILVGTRHSGSFTADAEIAPDTEAIYGKMTYGTTEYGE